jgi:hypothetical protein
MEVADTKPECSNLVGLVMNHFGKDRMEHILQEFEKQKIKSLEDLLRLNEKELRELIEDDLKLKPVLSRSDFIKEILEIQGNRKSAQGRSIAIVLLYIISNYLRVFPLGTQI